MRRFVDFAVRRPWLALGGALATIGALVFLFVAGGLVPITASSGHWPITEWFLHFAMRRSVVTHALAVPAPTIDLDDPAMILRGAGHFETGCRPCHGSPGEPLPAIPQAMTPHPPELAPRMGTWASGELFYIVKHGVKFTGMPAWPTQHRDDEVWAVVAFLRRLPGLGAENYARLVRGGESSLGEMADGAPAAPAAPDTVRAVCARCHGMDGRGRGAGAFPTLAGQRLDYMRRAMQAYAEGGRHSGLMQPLARSLPEASRQAALEYYAALPRVPADDPDAAVDPERVARGSRLAADGVPAQEIPACASCHSVEPVNPAYPRLHGQYRSYLAQQLRLLKGRQRGGSEFVHIMHNFVDRLSEQQIDDVAAYFATQSPDCCSQR